MNNKKPLLNEEQIKELVRVVLTEENISRPKDTMSRNVIENKLNKIQNKLDLLDIKGSAIQSTMYGDYMEIDVGQHEHLSVPLGLNIQLRHRNDHSYDKEIYITVPGIFMSERITNGYSRVEPGVTHILGSRDLNFPFIYIGTNKYYDMQGIKHKVLTLTVKTDHITQYQSKEIGVISPLSGVSVYDNSTSTVVESALHEFILPIRIKPVVNIGDHDLVRNDGTIVRSETVRVIESVSSARMYELLDTGTACSSTLYTVVGENELVHSSNVGEIGIECYGIQSEISISESINQSQTLLVDWGDGAVNSDTKHIYATPGSYNIKIYGRLENIQISQISTSGYISTSYVRIPEGYISPFFWNSTTLFNPFGDETMLRSPMFTLGDRVFANANSVQYINGLIYNPIATDIYDTSFYGENLLTGLTSLKSFNPEDFIYKCMRLPTQILKGLGTITSIRGLFRKIGTTHINVDLSELKDRIFVPASTIDMSCLFEEAVLEVADPIEMAQCRIFGTSLTKICDAMFKGTKIKLKSDVTGSVSFAISQFIKLNLAQFSIVTHASEMFSYFSVVKSSDGSILTTTDTFGNGVEIGIRSFLGIGVFGGSLVDASKMFKYSTVFNTSEDLAKNAGYMIHYMTNLKDVSEMFYETGIVTYRFMNESGVSMEQGGCDITNALCYVSTIQFPPGLSPLQLVNNSNTYGDVGATID